MPASANTDVSLEDFKPFVSEGFVSLPGDSTSLRPITILRDTGASQSLLLEGILPLSEASATGRSILLRGVELGCIDVPLHLIEIKSDLVSGPVVVGVRPTLPLEGISLLLGNDLAGGKVIAEPIVTREPNLSATPEEDQELYPACAVTRAMSLKASQEESSTQATNDFDVDLETTFFSTLEESLPSSSAKPASTRQQLIEEQKKDPELAKLRETAMSSQEAEQVSSGYYIKDDTLFRKWKPPDATDDEEWRIVHQIVVPERYRADIMNMAHDTPMSGHLGIHKTYHKILSHFFWPRLKKDVVRYCRSCHTCQTVGKPNQKIPVAPLKPIPAFEEPFSRILIDCVGPLPRTKTGNQYLLTLMCAATRFPEAIPLRNIKTQNIVKALTKFFTLFGLPKSIQSDQGSNFTAKLFKQVMDQLGVEHCMSSAYHAESQGALERFHQTLKNMMRTFCHEHEKDWDEGVPMLLFATREAVQESLGFSPFELVFGHQVRGPLKCIKEKWLSQESNDGLLEYVVRFKSRLRDACLLAQDNLKGSQTTMKCWYDKKARSREFFPGDKVLVFLPIPGQPLQARYFGPYEVESKLSDLNYIVKTPDRRKKSQLCHINMLKPYISRSEKHDEGITVANVVNTFPVDNFSPNDTDIVKEKFGQYKIPNSSVLQNLDLKLSHLSLTERSSIVNIINDFKDLFSDVPRKTHVIVHDVDVSKASPIKQHPYRLNPEKLEILRSEVQYLLENDLIEPSSSSWSSPCVLIPKQDKTYRLCTDYRKVNAVSKTDSFPIPRVDDLIDRVGDAKFMTKIDLLSGYWQVPLTDRAKEISAFVTPDGLYQYKVMPFGMKNAPATFQRMMNTLLADMETCHSYVDDVILYSHDFESHCNQLRCLFNILQQANLTVNLNKSDFCQAHIQYLGHVVGQGQVRPVMAKVEAIQAFPIPADRKQLRRFLGMAGFYRKFCENFSVIATPLTNLLKKNVRFIWTDECQKAFDQIKNILSSSPVLISPDFNKQFKLAIDASDAGVGAVLFQEDGFHVDHPVCFFSKKFNRHQKNYSTVEKECLGLILALQQFEFYLSGSRFPIIVFTDHNPLTFVHKMSGKNQRLLRWSLFLQEFNLDIVHIKGSDNVIADALSRL